MVEESSALAARRLPGVAQRPVLTNFYPLYDGANDQVDPVIPVRRAFFQRVIPRYRLSTSETRDEGLGPDFIYAPAYPPSGPAARHAAAGREPASPGGQVSGPGVAAPSRLYRLDSEPPIPREPWLGRQINRYV